MMMRDAETPSFAGCPDQVYPYRRTAEVKPGIPFLIQDGPNPLLHLLVTSIRQVRMRERRVIFF